MDWLNVLHLSFKQRSAKSWILLVLTTRNRIRTVLFILLIITLVNNKLVIYTSEKALVISCSKHPPEFSYLPF